MGDILYFRLPAVNIASRSLSPSQDDQLTGSTPATGARDASISRTDEDGLPAAAVQLGYTCIAGPGMSDYVPLLLHTSAMTEYLFAFNNVDHTQ